MGTAVGAPGMDAVRPPDEAPDAALDAALRLVRGGDFERAERICQHVLLQWPGQPDALHLLGRIALGLGRHKIALVLLGQATARRPSNPTFHRYLAEAQRTLNQLDASASSFRRALDLAPNDAKAHCGLAATLLAAGSRDQAIACFRRALELAPDHARSLHGLGVALLQQSQHEEAITCFRRALELAPDFAEAQAGIVFALHYLPCDREALFVETCGWGARHAEPLAHLAPAHTNDADPNRRLRVGYVSADLHNHPVGYFLESVLAAHDRSAFEVFCYANELRVDDTTRRLRAASDHWRIIWGLYDEPAVELIRRDAIDILVDLSGHTAGSRLLLFARKPAPVQATWLGYFDTTGMRTMDYLIADGVVCPPGDEHYYVEQIVRLPNDFLCYTPPRYEKSVGPPPAQRHGHVTYGCFNNVSKITPEVVALWSDILRRVPGSRLTLKSGALRDESVAARYGALFARHGVGGERLTLLGDSSHGEYLEAYGEIDIGLDPFPYNGGTTTIDAMWMGVPTITLAGDRFVSRMGVSHLTAVGLEELVAGSPEEYARLAVALANDGERLASLRGDLRGRLLRSPLCDAAGFTRGLEVAYRQMWRGWCAGRG